MAYLVDPSAREGSEPCAMLRRAWGGLKASGVDVLPAIGARFQPQCKLSCLVRGQTPA